MEEQKMIETELSTYNNEFLILHRNNISRFEISGRHGFFCSSCQRTSQIFNIKKIIKRLELYNV